MYNAMAAALLTFKLSTLLPIGIFTSRSHFSRVSLRRPFPSAPNMSAMRSGIVWLVRVAVAVPSKPQHQKSCFLR